MQETSSKFKVRVGDCAFRIVLSDQIVDDVLGPFQAPDEGLGNESSARSEFWVWVPDATRTWARSIMVAKCTRVERYDFGYSCFAVAYVVVQPSEVVDCVMDSFVEGDAALVIGKGQCFLKGTEQVSGPG